MARKQREQPIEGSINIGGARDTWTTARHVADRASRELRRPTIRDARGTRNSPRQEFAPIAVPPSRAASVVPLRNRPRCPKIILVPKNPAKRVEKITRFRRPVLLLRRFYFRRAASYCDVSFRPRCGGWVHCDPPVSLQPRDLSFSLSFVSLFHRLIGEMLEAFSDSLISNSIIFHRRSLRVYHQNRGNLIITTTRPVTTTISHFFKAQQMLRESSLEIDQATRKPNVSLFLRA